MLDQLFSSIGGDVVNTLTEKTGLSADQAQQMLPIAKDTVSSGLMDQVKSGNIAGLASMFSGGTNNLAGNSIFEGMKTQLIAGVMEKLGLPKPLAAMASGLGLEKILGLIGNKVSDDNGNVDQGDLMSKLGLQDAAMDMGKKMLQDKLGGALGGLGKGLFG